MKIHTLDLLFQDVPQAIASYLVEGPAGWLLVETGPMSTFETLKLRLSELGLSPADIQHVLVTHIHLDHAGAAGWWASRGAHIYVHHVGAPHLIDPSKLWRSASLIYGKQMAPLWGEIIPAPAENVIIVRDGDVVSAAGLTLTALDTPGHAWHHHVYRLGNVAFSGDAVGVRLAESKWISLPAPPPEFDLETWLQTLDRLEEERFEALYLTHFGRCEDVSGHLHEFRHIIMAATDLVRQGMEMGMERGELVEEYISWSREQALGAGVATADFDRYETANPLSMSVDGILRYWRKKGVGL